MLRGLHQIVGSLMYAENFYIVRFDAERQTIRFLYFADSHDPDTPDPEDELSPLEMGSSLTLALLRPDLDFGQTTSVAGVEVIELDRWTWKSLADAKLATDGVPTAPFKGAVPYTNQNTKLTFTIPVADGARILVSHCIAADQPRATSG